MKENYIRKDEAAQRMKVVNTPEASAKVERGTKGDSRSEKSSQTRLAELRYRVLASSPSLSCVEVDLITGRKHQIRLQLSNLGHPVLGDRKYGSTRKFSSGIALHCAELTIQHPTKKDQMCFRAATPNSWQQKDGSLLEEALKRWNALKDSVDG